jgi:hypothetical protein
MKSTIVVAMIVASLAFQQGAPARRICNAGSCPPAPTPAVVGRLASITSDELVMPQYRVLSPRDCVGFPRVLPRVALV